MRQVATVIDRELRYIAADSNPMDPPNARLRENSDKGFCGTVVCYRMYNTHLKPAKSGH